jgi:hypothetical protein
VYRKSSDDIPLLFFVFRDSYTRVGGVSFVAAANEQQFEPDFVARVLAGFRKKRKLQGCLSLLFLENPRQRKLLLAVNL